MSDIKRYLINCFQKLKTIMTIKTIINVIYYLLKNKFIESSGSNYYILNDLFKFIKEACYNSELYITNTSLLINSHKNVLIQSTKKEGYKN